MSEKPFGWRPMSAEHRKSLVDAGFTEEQIIEQEESNVYRPNHDAVLAREFALALLDVVAREKGPSAVNDFRTALEGRAKKMAGSDEAEDQVDSKILRSAIDNEIDWQAIIDRASDPQHERWQHPA